jgi:hypothetical protein
VLVFGAMGLFSVAARAGVIYSTDFTSDPGWTTNDPTKHPSKVYSVI